MFFVTISIIICLLILAALISATETAITATSPGLIQKLKIEGNKKASILLEILKIKDKAISTLLIGNSIANTLCTTIGTGLFIELYGDDMGTIISSIVMSFAIIIFSEVVPKAIAVVKANQLSVIAAPILVIFLKILEPVNIVLAYIIKIFCFLFRIDLSHKISATDEVRGVIEHHLSEGNVVKDDRDMLGGVLDMKDLKIADIMTHRSQMTAINIEADIDKIIDIIFSSTHSRFPFWQENQDNIIGILHVRDLMYKIYEVKRDISKEDLKALLSAPVFVPDNSLVVQQLSMFKSGQTHLACVVNEYGDLQGIITLEDILEEIVGQIYDEHDINNHRISKLPGGIFIINGEISIRDINREMNWQIPEEEANSLAGFIVNRLGKIPQAGESLEYENFKMTVMTKTNSKIRMVKIFLRNNHIAEYNCFTLLF
jgi:Mg2+/Co2+ transporter CorB